MKDMEFFPSEEEFSPSGPEFSQAGEEFSPSGREYSAPGMEFYEESESDLQPESRKRKRSPLMLAAAAVMTAVVAIAVPGVQENVEPKPEYPLCEITEGHRDYLETVWTAVDSGDVEAMTELAGDPRLRELLVDYIAPYAYEMEETYGSRGVFYSKAGIEEGADAQRADYYRYYFVYYDGENLGTLETLCDSERPSSLLWVYYSADEYCRDVRFQLEDFKVAGWTVGKQYTEKDFECTQYLQDGYTNVFWCDQLRECIEDYGKVTSVAVEYSYYEKTVWGTEQKITELWANGETAKTETSSGERLEEYLENGALAYAYSEGGRSGSAEIVVRDGWLSLDEHLSVESINDIWYQIVFEDGHELTWDWMSHLNDGTPEEYLYHLFRIRSFVGDST